MKTAAREYLATFEELSEGGNVRESEVAVKRCRRSRVDSGEVRSEVTIRG